MIRAFQNCKEIVYIDRHHAHMVRNYKEVPNWWYWLVLFLSFVLGLVVVITQKITLPVWGYIVAFLLGTFIAPLVSLFVVQHLPVSSANFPDSTPQSVILYARYGSGIATNALSKMLAGLLIPERPVGNMYFAGFSHNVIYCAVGLCNDLKMGEYRECPSTSYTSRD